MRLAVTLLGLDLFTIEVSTDAETESEEPGDATSFAVGFTPTPARPREPGEDYE